MSFDIDSAKLANTPDSRSWSQVFSIKSEKSGKSVSFFAVISAYSKEGLKPATKSFDDAVVDMTAANITSAKTIFSKLESEYFVSAKTSTLDALKESLTKTVTDFEDFWDSLEISVMLFVDKTLYLAVSGGSKIALYRNGQLVNLLTSIKGKILSGSGYPQTGDIFIVGTTSFFDVFGPTLLKSALRSADAQSATEELATKLSLGEGRGDIAALFLKVVTISQGKKLKLGFKDKNLGRFGKLLPRSWQGLKEKASTITSNFTRKKIYVGQKTRSELSKSKKVSASVGIILILLLAVSVVFGARQAKFKEYKNWYEQMISQARHELQEAEEIYPISPVRSRELLNESRKKIEELKTKGVEEAELNNLISEIEKKREDILGEHDTFVDLFVDLSLLSSGFNGDFVSSSDEALYVLDSQNRRLVKIMIDTKRSEVIAGPNQIGEVKEMAVYADNVYVLTPHGISEVGGGSDRLIDPDWEGEVLIYAYAGNLYLLDKSKSEIARYAGVGGGFASKSSWLAEGTQSNLANSVSWTIDGSIWVLSSGNRILKFSLGNPQRFDLQGVYPEISAISAIYTNEELNYLYLLEPSQRRVIIVSKEGEYKAQYKADELASAKNLIVSEKEGKIILLAGEKLLEIGIEHLD